MALSGLVISDLSDYLAPSQICIKPVEQVSPPPDDEAEKEDGGAATEIRMEVDAMEVERDGFAVKRAGAEVNGAGEGEGKKRTKKLQKAQITLNDCLACSGCITSAESVLVSLQSHTELISTLESHPSLVPILSIAPQSLASLAALHGLPPRATLWALRRFFKRELGFRLVFDTTFAREVGLLEAQREFSERQELASAAKAEPFDKGKRVAREQTPLPLLASACPGWICYAEKTHGALLPFISRVKSPQQIQGSLVKGALVGRRLDLEPRQIYHVAVMMCYDKKLEASRPDFAVKGAGQTEQNTPGARDVDCVLTTGEVQKLLDERGWDLRQTALDVLREKVGSADEESAFLPECLPGRGTASGGYLHNVLRGVAAAVPSTDWSRLALTVEPKRGQDYVDYTLSLAPASPSSHPTTLFKGAQCYGFRNLQNLVRKLGREQGIAFTRGAAGFAPPTAPSSGTTTPTGRGKSAAAMAAAARRSAKRKPGIGGGGLDSGTVSPAEPAVADRPYDYVEVMACPSGCVNGGGQVPPPISKDAEGMPIVEDGEWKSNDVEIKMVGDLDGLNGTSKPVAVRSAKEWVELVERIYWSISPTQVPSDTMDLSPPISKELNDAHPSVRPLVTPLPDFYERMARELMAEVEGAGLRDEYFRTGYRAVESEEVNGLAVKW